MSENDYILSIVARQLKGLASAAELQELQTWLQADAAHQQQYDEWMNIWQSSERLLAVPGFDTKSAWAKVDGRLQQNAAARPDAAPPRPAVFTLKRFAVAAALIAAIGLFAWWWFTRTVWDTVTATAANELITLPDKSRVHIRKGSSLHFPKQFGDKQRLVELTGEAFFEVQHREGQPFKIVTSHSAIQVLGTSFLVHTSESTDEVVVVSGKVQVEDKSKKSKLVVPAGQKVILRQHRFTQQQVTDSNFIAWKTGHLQFDNAPLPKVLADVAHYYNVIIELDPGSTTTANALRINVRFDNQPLEEVLEEIRLTTGLALKKENGKITFFQK